MILAPGGEAYLNIFTHNALNVSLDRKPCPSSSKQAHVGRPLSCSKNAYKNVCSLQNFGRPAKDLQKMRPATRSALQSYVCPVSKGG